jgi:hypothetical protein
MPTIDVGKTFYHRLANRDRNQGDGKHNAVDFRQKFLAALDSAEAWRKEPEPIVFDFTNVKKIGPSFANEAFGYFTKYVKPHEFLKKVQFIHITDVQMMIINEELESGYTGK